jgi:hypothetical protein
MLETCCKSNYMSKPTLSNLTPKFIIPTRKYIIEKIFFQNITCLPQLEFYYFLK